MNAIMRLLKEATTAAYDAQCGFDYRWDMMNKGAKRMPEDDLSMSALGRRSAVVAKARTDMQKIMDDLAKEASE